MPEPNAQLTTLRALRDATTDPAQRAALDAAIAALEAAAPPPGSVITNQAPNQGAQGIFYGHVFLAGQCGKSAAQLLAGYLQRQVQRCGSLPLQGVYQQNAADDTLKISLEQVYTQLATTELAEREHYVDGDKAYEPAAVATYLHTHVGDHLLPSQQRTAVTIARHWAPQHFWAPHTTDIQRHYLRDLADTPEKLTEQLVQCDGLQFFGPQLVTEAITANQHLVLLGEPGSGKVRRMTARAIARNAPRVGAMTCEVDRLTGGGTTQGTTACR